MFLESRHTGGGTGSISVASPLFKRQKWLYATGQMLDAYAITVSAGRELPLSEFRDLRACMPCRSPVVDRIGGSVTQLSSVRTPYL